MDGAGLFHAQGQQALVGDAPAASSSASMQRKVWSAWAMSANRLRGAGCALSAIVRSQMAQFTLLETMQCHAVLSDSNSLSPGSTIARRQRRARPSTRSAAARLSREATAEAATLERDESQAQGQIGGDALVEYQRGRPGQSPARSMAMDVARRQLLRHAQHHDEGQRRRQRPGVKITGQASGTARKAGAPSRRQASAASGTVAMPVCQGIMSAPSRTCGDCRAAG